MPMKLNKPEDAIKAIFSSLFARKMPYLILGNFERVNTWYMTNISLDEVTIYSPSTEHVIHEIVFVDTEPLTMITSRFPLLNKMVGCIDVSKVCGAMNKYKGATPLDLKVAQNGIDVEIVGDDFVGIVGRLSAPEIVSTYVSLLDNHICRGKPSDSPRELKFPVDLASIDKNEIAKVRVNSDHADSLQAIWRVNVPLKDGFNMISCYEYWRKSKQDNAKMDVCVCASQSGGRTIRTLCRYVDEWMKIISVQPGAVWFPMKRDQD